MRVVINLAGPPRGKGRGRAFVTKIEGKTTARVFTDAKTRSYETQLRAAAEDAMGAQLPTLLPCSVIVEARFDVPHSWSGRKQYDALRGAIRPTVKPDADNLLKVMDGLNKIVWKDDSQIVQATIRKVYSERPGMTIIVETWEPPSAEKAPARQEAQPALFPAG